MLVFSWNGSYVCMTIIKSGAKCKSKYVFLMRRLSATLITKCSECITNRHDDSEGDDRCTVSSFLSVCAETVKGITEP